LAANGIQTQSVPKDIEYAKIVVRH